MTVMDQRRWEEVRVAFDQLADLEESDRSRRLASLRETHPEIRDAVAALLRADADVDARLESIETAFLNPLGAAPKDTTDVYEFSGRTLSHFGVDHPLGAGGMGIVYRAVDLRLGRAVALKFLLPDLVRDPVSKGRFLREARAMAALDHRNVCAVHEVAETDEGVPFFAMPLYAGETLQTRLKRKGVLSTEEATTIARQIAEGLACAHQAGIVHRDLKPGNVMLLDDGSVKILDFGVAKARDQTSSVSGAVIGTVAYMSPEQLRGEAVDARTDLWSLGIVLFEMVSGTRPLPGVSPFHHSARGDRSEPILPADVRLVVESLLEDRVDHRYQTAQEVAAALAQLQETIALRRPAPTRAVVEPTVRLQRQRLITAALAIAAVAAGLWAVRTSRIQTGEPKSIVVLPFDNLTGGAERNYFAVGLHDALLTELGRLSALRVVSRTSAIQSKATGRSAAQIARDLDVDVVVEGSALKSADSVRLNLRLVSPVDERQLWAQAFDGELSNVLTVLKDATRAIAEQMQVPLTKQDRARLAQARAVNPVAYETYLHGLYEAESFTQEGLTKGIGLLRDAIRREPENPLPYAALARIYAYSGVGHGSAVARRAAFAEAKALASKAVELDETSSDAHGSLGAIHLFHDWDWAGAARELRRAIALEPNSSTARWGYALYLTAMMQFDSAIAENRRAKDLDPLSRIILGDLAVRYYVAGKYDSAISWAHTALELEPTFPPALWVLGVAHRQKGSYLQAIEAHERALAGNPVFRSDLAITYAVAGRTRAARQILANMDDATKRTAAFHVAQVHAALGERDEALRWLEVAYDEHHPWLHWIRFEPTLATLRSEPRYKEILRRLRLPES